MTGLSDATVLVVAMVEDAKRRDAFAQARRNPTRSSASCEVHDATAPSLELELPDVAEFRPLPPCCSMVQMMQRSRQLRRWFPSGLRTCEERWQAKTAVEFHL